MSEELNDIEQQKLKNLESIIERNLPLIRMTPQEARACVDDINNNLRNTRALLLDLYEREGWRALGYDSWRACVTGEFVLKQAHLYRELMAAKIERQVSPKGEIGMIPETHLRPLTKIKDPEEQREVYQKAVETAPEGKVTARHVEKTVQEHKKPSKKVDLWVNVRPKPIKMSEDFKKAYDAMFAILYNERCTGWKTTSRETAEKCLATLLGMTQYEGGQTS